MRHACEEGRGVKENKLCESTTRENNLLWETIPRMLIKKLLKTL